jgi:hypothetical protein
MAAQLSGDRIQVIAPGKALGIANRDLAAVESSR